ncbi:MAG: phosphopantothenoylcysteine decarboxylase [Planctomycetota bacterium]|nr:MAG: phosphopantothenoylcysteine decarboxylase [Planctomycetota bacterium]
MRVLVTAGPTREPLDPVRYLSNRSSGRMGYAVARALLRAGHKVVLVTGPTALRPPAGASVVRVETAREMLAACRRHWRNCDAVVAVAAVADWRPARAAAVKLKRGDAATTLELVANPDILATLARTKGRRLAVGFALESGDGRQEAWRKLRGKNLDAIVLNGPRAQGAARATLQLLRADGGEARLGPAAKEVLARRLVRCLFGPRRSPKV